jgi:hypothetical protein
MTGAIECRPSSLLDDDIWLFAVDLSALSLGRDYDAFGCLFGVRNYAGFRPLAPKRGLPPDIAELTANDAGRFTEKFGATWITWNELQSVDWDEPALHADVRLHQFRRLDDGTWRFETKASWSPVAEQLGITIEQGISGTKVFPEGSEWQIGDRLYRAERLTRRDAVPPDGDWAIVWTMMSALAERHGPDNVRLVVWFYN